MLEKLKEKYKGSGYKYIISKGKNSGIGRRIKKLKIMKYKKENNEIICVTITTTNVNKIPVVPKTNSANSNNKYEECTSRNNSTIDKTEVHRNTKDPFENFESLLTLEKRFTPQNTPIGHEK